MSIETEQRKQVEQTYEELKNKYDEVELDYKDTVERLREENLSLNSELEKLQSSIQDNKQQYSIEIENCEAKFKEKLSKEKESLERELEEKLNQAQTEFDNFRGNSDEEKQSLLTKIEQLKEDNIKLNSAVQNLENAGAERDQTQVIDELKNKINKIKERCREDLTALMNERDKYKVEYENLAGKFDHLAEKYEKNKAILKQTQQEVDKNKGLREHKTECEQDLTNKIVILE